jgi:hypothetical protein
MKKIDHIKTSLGLRVKALTTLFTTATLLIGLHIGSPVIPSRIELVPSAKANSVYFNMSAGSLNFAVSPSTVNQITTNDDWSAVSSVEGYMGQNLTATHGVNPQTILGTEFAGNTLPNTPRNIAANKGNPSAFNAGGLAEFDSGTYLAIGFQGNVQANPYMVFYLNTLGRINVTMNYTVQDIDSGSNNSVSPIALQYRVGETGLFTNLPTGYIADATDGGVAGRSTNVSVVLPSNANNQPKVQVRIITTNAADTGGSSTPDEWIGVNNVVASSSLGPTAANVSLSGRVIDPYGMGVSRASVTMYSASGATRTAFTNTFGSFSFSDVQVGVTYNFIVQSKRYSFTPRTVMVVDELKDLNFVADQ